MSIERVNRESVDNSIDLTTTCDQHNSSFNTLFRYAEDEWLDQDQDQGNQDYSRNGNKNRNSGSRMISQKSESEQDKSNSRALQSEAELDAARATLNATLEVSAMSESAKMEAASQQYSSTVQMQQANLAAEFKAAQIEAQINAREIAERMSRSNYMTQIREKPATDQTVKSNHLGEVDVKTSVETIPTSNHTGEIDSPMVSDNIDDVNAEMSEYYKNEPMFEENDNQAWTSSEDSSDSKQNMLKEDKQVFEKDQTSDPSIDSNRQHDKEPLEKSKTLFNQQIESKESNIKQELVMTYGEEDSSVVTELDNFTGSGNKLTQLLDSAVDDFNSKDSGSNLSGVSHFKAKQSDVVVGGKLTKPLGSESNRDPYTYAELLSKIINGDTHESMSLVYSYDSEKDGRIMFQNRHVVFEKSQECIAVSRIKDGAVYETDALMDISQSVFAIDFAKELLQLTYQTRSENYHEIKDYGNSTLGINLQNVKKIINILEGKSDVQEAKVQLELLAKEINKLQEGLNQKLVAYEQISLQKSFVLDKVMKGSPKEVALLIKLNQEGQLVSSKIVNKGQLFVSAEMRNDTKEKILKNDRGDQKEENSNRSVSVDSTSEFFGYSGKKTDDAPPIKEPFKTKSLLFNPMSLKRLDSELSQGSMEPLETPRVDVVTPRAELGTPRVDVVTPRVELGTPRVDVVTPRVDVITPRPGEHPVTTPRLVQLPVQPPVDVGIPKFDVKPPVKNPISIEKPNTNSLSNGVVIPPFKVDLTTLSKPPI